jgi:RNase adaptor protein for sRNA GlmZ degradation
MEPEFHIHLRVFSYAASEQCVGAMHTLDCRDFPDPRFIPSLQGKDGRSGDVQSWIMERDALQGEKMMRAVNTLIKNIEKNVAEKRRFVTIDIGCATGRHQSVVAADLLDQLLWNVFRDRSMHLSMIRTQFPLGPSENDTPFEELSAEEKKLPREFLGLPRQTTPSHV